MKDNITQRGAARPPPSTRKPVATRLIEGMFGDLLSGEAQQTRELTLVRLPRPSANEQSATPLERDLARLARLAVWCAGAVLVGITILILTVIAAICVGVLVGFGSHRTLFVGLSSGGVVVTVGSSLAARWTKNQLAAVRPDATPGVD